MATILLREGFPLTVNGSVRPHHSAGALRATFRSPVASETPWPILFLERAGIRDSCPTPSLYRYASHAKVDSGDLSLLPKKLSPVTEQNRAYICLRFNSIGVGRKGKKAALEPWELCGRVVSCSWISIVSPGVSNLCRSPERFVRRLSKNKHAGLPGKTARRLQKARGIIMVGRTESWLVTRIMSKVSSGRATPTLCTAFTSDLAVGRENGSYASGIVSRNKQEMQARLGRTNRYEP